VTLENNKITELTIDAVDEAFTEAQNVPDPDQENRASRSDPYDVLGIGFKHMRETQIMTVRAFWIFSLIALFVISFNAAAKSHIILNGYQLSLRELTMNILTATGTNNCI